LVEVKTGNDRVVADDFLPEHRPAAIGRPAIGVDPHGIDAEERCACASSRINAPSFTIV
jgi:hypothetical protein